MPADDTHWQAAIRDQSDDHDAALAKCRDGGRVFDDVEGDDR